MKRKSFVVGMALALAGTVAFASACGASESSKITQAVTREDGSGTRSAFDELVKSSEGVSIEKALETAFAFASNVSEANSTNNVVTKVAASPVALGYISLGSISANAEKVKAVKVEGVEATKENVVNGSYLLSRPFNIVYRTYEGLSDLAKNFISYIESAEGQTIIDEGYIAAAQTVVEYTPYTGELTTLTLTGSTSVQPVMNELAAAYKKHNPSVTVNVSGDGSGQGVSDAMNGTNDIGMISRELKSSEQGLVSRKIADDGIAVIVNKNCPLANVTFDQIFRLYLEGTPIPFEES